MGSGELALRRDTTGGKWKGRQARKGQTRTPEQSGRVAWLTPPTSAPNRIQLFPEGEVCKEGGGTKVKLGVGHILHCM